MRRLKKRTQDDVAFALNLKRSTYSGYENGVGEPSLEKLMALANYFKISLDGLIATDLRRVAISQLPNFLPGKENLGLENNNCPWQ